MKKLKKPGKGPGAHGSIAEPTIAAYGKAWPQYGVEIPGTCYDFAAYYKTKDMRALAKWLVQAADWIDAQSLRGVEPK